MAGFARFPASVWFWPHLHPGAPCRWLHPQRWAAAIAYCIVWYKTPWCLISILWPFSLHLRPTPWTGCGASIAGWPGSRGAVLGIPAIPLRLLNFRNATLETEPYVYVIARRLFKITGRWKPPCAATRRAPPPRYIIADINDTHPFPGCWRIHRIRFLAQTRLAQRMDADFLYVADPYISDVGRPPARAVLLEHITLRGNGGESANILFPRGAFACVFRSESRSSRRSSGAGSCLEISVTPALAPAPEAAPAPPAPPLRFVAHACADPIHARCGSALATPTPPPPVATVTPKPRLRPRLPPSPSDFYCDLYAMAAAVLASLGFAFAQGGLRTLGLGCRRAGRAGRRHHLFCLSAHRPHRRRLGPWEWGAVGLFTLFALRGFLWVVFLTH